MTTNLIKSNLLSRLNERLNKTFEFCILLSFMTASTGICFIGYNLTSSRLQDAIKFGLFLGAEVVQIAAICYYGDSIVEAVSLK